MTTGSVVTSRLPPNLQPPFADASSAVSFPTSFLEGHQANGAFVACGPPGFTALALIKLGEAARTILPEFNLISPMAGEIFYASSVMGALMLLGLALFFFVFGALPYAWKVHKHL